MRTKFTCMFGLLILMSAITIGCGDDKGPMAPQVGAITINPEPNSINAPWQITGPNGFSQSGLGDAILADLTEGSYTLTWGAVANWTKPANALGTLAAGASLTLSGTYVVDVNHDAEFVLIPAGTFMMGSPTTEPGRTDETQHQVTLTYGIYVQTTEVTNQQYLELAQWAYDHGYATVIGYAILDNLDGSTQVLTGLNDGISFNNGVFSCINPDHPVNHVTWYGSVAYCDWLSLQQELPRAYSHVTWLCNAGNPYTAVGYRLPTEAEWEYSCRAGSTTAFANGAITQLGCDPIDPNLNLMGWYCGNAENGTHPVAQKLPNAWGLYDMHGNSDEWCNDWWGSYGGTVTDPAGAGTGDGRVVRGGYWDFYAMACRSAYRNYNNPVFSSSGVGFRPVRSAN